MTEPPQPLQLLLHHQRRRTRRRRLEVAVVVLLFLILQVSFASAASNSSATAKTATSPINNKNKNNNEDPDDPNDGIKETKTTSSGNSNNTSSTSGSSSGGVLGLGLAEQFENARRNFQDPDFQSTLKDYWKKTLAEIRNLAGTSTSRSHSNSSSPTTNNDPFFFNQWKQLLDANATTTTFTIPTATTEDEDELALSLSLSLARPRQEVGAPKTATTTRRFEGFVTWDRLLQDWSDEIQAYLDRVQDENNAAAMAGGGGGDIYPFSTYGRPLVANTSRAETVIAVKTELGASIDQVETETEKTTTPLIAESNTSYSTSLGMRGSAIAIDTEKPDAKKIALPVPAPVKPNQEVLPHTNVRDKSKRIWIVTTASLPWKTGTAVNPLLRAAYLTSSRDKDAGGSVTLMLPWLERPSDQDRIYGKGKGFATPQEQETFIRTWLRESAGMPQASVDLNIQWYTGWQNPVENSIYSMGDITALIPDDACDIMILEEPEHLNWYRAPGESWTKKFKHVVGILHTNYFQYALDQPAALVRGPGMKLLCSWMCRAHCHRVIKLSGTLGKVAPEKELVENVHGVRETFLDVGRQVRKLILDDRDLDKTSPTTSVFAPDAEPTVYFLGKLLWSKGLGSLMELLKYAEETADLRIKVDMYGGGPDQAVAEAKAQKLGLDMPFHGPLDHAELAFTHKIFVNPSTSEVLCTASAEALAMGKFVILPSHPSNDFFAQFQNCLAYATKEEFVGNLYYAMTHSPEPLSPESLYALSWEAATERFEAAACISVEEAEAFAAAHAAQQAAIEISLPPLVEDGSARKALAYTLRQTRDRYRSFRLRLSAELRQSNVLPKQLRDRLVDELEKRLDLDIEELLESPKLRLQLSPAELDKSLLELYNTISESPSGDLLRLIGGGGAIGLQNMYMRQQTQKKLMSQPGIFAEFFPSPLDDKESEDAKRTPAQRVQWALRKYVPNNVLVASKTTATKDNALASSSSKSHDTLSMSAGTLSPMTQRHRPAQWSGFRAPKTSFRVARRPLSLSLLI